MFLDHSNSTNSHNLVSEIPQSESLIYLNSNNINGEEEININDLLQVLKRRSLIIIGTAVTLSTLLSVYILNRPLQYQGKVQIQIENVNTAPSGLGALSGLTAITGRSGLPSTGLDYPSQISILTSPLVMDPIIKNIQTRYPDIVYFIPEDQKNEENDKEPLSEKLKVEQAGTTKIIDITYTSRSREKILYVLDQVTQGYLDYQRDESSRDPKEQLQFTEDQIRQFSKRVADLETEVENFLKRNNIITPESYGGTLSTQFTFLSQESQRVNLELQGARKLAAELEAKMNLTPEQGVIVTRLNREPYYLKLVGQIKDTEAKIATETITLGLDHPTIEKLQQEKEELIELLDKETQRILGKPYKNLPLDFFTSFSNNQTITQSFFDVNNQIQVLETRQKTLDQARNRLTQDINNLSTTNKEFIQLQRRLRVATENLTRLLALRESLQIEVSKQTAPWVLLTPIDDNIVEEVSDKPRKILLVVTGSLFLAGILGFLVDKLDSKLYTAENVKKIVNLPILGKISDNKKLFNQTPEKFAQKELMVLKGLLKNNSKTFNLDNYFSIYNNIIALNSTRSIKSITMSTIEANQGQSIISIYLAKAATMANKKVLLVDLNLREPKLHKYLGLEDTQGISDVIEDDISVNDVIQPSKLDNLFVLSAGTKIGNPVGILSSAKMESITETLKNDFDFVIYNTPELAEFSDAKIVTPLTEGLIFIIALGKTNEENLEKVIGELQIAKLSVLGMIINGEG